MLKHDIFDAYIGRERQLTFKIVWHDKIV